MSSSERERSLELFLATISSDDAIKGFSKPTCFYLLSFVLSEFERISKLDLKKAKAFLVVRLTSLP